MAHFSKGPRACVFAIIRPSSLVVDFGAIYIFERTRKRNIFLFVLEHKSVRKQMFWEKNKNKVCRYKKCRYLLCAFNISILVHTLLYGILRLL